MKCGCCENSGRLRENKLGDLKPIAVCDECWPSVERWQNAPQEQRDRTMSQIEANLPALNACIAELDAVIHELRGVQ